MQCRWGALPSHLVDVPEAATNQSDEGMLRFQEYLHSATYQGHSLPGAHFPIYLRHIFENHLILRSASDILSLQILPLPFYMDYVDSL